MVTAQVSYKHRGMKQIINGKERAGGTGSGAALVSSPSSAIAQPLCDLLPSGGTGTDTVEEEPICLLFVCLSVYQVSTFLLVMLDITLNQMANSKQINQNKTLKFSYLTGL